VIQLAFWIAGLLVGLGSLPGFNPVSSWWYGLCLAVLLVPLPPLVFVPFPRLTLNFVSGCMMGSFVAFVVCPFMGGWVNIPGALLAGLVSSAATNSSRKTLDEIERAY